MKIIKTPGHEKISNVFNAVRSYVRFSKPSKSEKGLYLDITAFCSQEENRYNAIDEEISLPNDANFQLPFQIIVPIYRQILTELKQQQKGVAKNDQTELANCLSFWKKIYENHAEKIISSEVRECNMVKMQELFSLVGLRKDVLFSSFIIHITNRLNNKMDLIITKREAEKRIISKLLEISNSEHLIGTTSDLLQQFYPCPAKIAILTEVINKLKDRFKEVKKITGIETDEAKMAKYNWELELIEINVKRFHKELKGTKVDMALIDAKINKKDLKKFKDTNSLIFQLFEKFGTSKNSNIEWETLINLINEIAIIYKTSVFEIYLMMVVHFCHEWEKISGGSESDENLKSDYQELTVKIISRHTKVECQKIFGSDLDQVTGHFNSSTVEQYFFECMVSAGKIEYLKGITGLEEPALRNHLLNNKYITKIKKIGLTIKQKNLKNAAKLEEYLEANLKTHFSRDLDSLSILVSMIIDYNIKRSDFLEFTFDILEKQLPESRKVLKNLLDFVETKVEMSFACVDRITESLEQINNVENSKGPIDKTRKQMYQDARSPRVNRGHSRIKSLKYDK